jgi:hypothetical protein
MTTKPKVSRKPPHRPAWSGPPPPRPEPPPSSPAPDTHRDDRPPLKRPHILEDKAVLK